MRLRSTQLENRVGLCPGGERKAAAGAGGSEGLRGAHGPGRSPRVSVNGDQSSQWPPAYLRPDIINLGRKASEPLSGRMAPLMGLINYSQQHAPSTAGPGKVGDGCFMGAGYGETAPCTHCLCGQRVLKLSEASGCLVPQFPQLALRDQVAVTCVGVSGCTSGGCSEKGQAR